MSAAKPAANKGPGAASGNKAASGKKATSSKKKTASAKKAAPAKKVTSSKKKTASAKKAAPGKKAAPAQKAAAKKSATALSVRPDEKPWSTGELNEVRSDLAHDRDRLVRDIDIAERELQDLLRGGMDGAGNDQADVGSSTLERDSEMSLAANQREMLLQVVKALGRIEDGTYGRCEQCGNPIGKMRLMAFPRATLCMTCKQREERR